MAIGTIGTIGTGSSHRAHRDQRACGTVGTIGTSETIGTFGSIGTMGTIVAMGTMETIYPSTPGHRRLTHLRNPEEEEEDPRPPGAYRGYREVVQISYPRPPGLGGFTLQQTSSMLFRGGRPGRPRRGCRILNRPHRVYRGFLQSVKEEQMEPPRVSRALTLSISLFFCRCRRDTGSKGVGRVHGGSLRRPGPPS